MAEATTLSVEEVRRRLPEVGLVEQEPIRDAVIDALATGTPDYFWEAPATTSNKFHNPYCRGRHGLWIHVKMVATVYERLSVTYQNQDLIDAAERDFGRAAVLLHDIRKYGDIHSPGKRADKDHDLQAAAFIREETALPEPVADAVAAHMGPWYEGPAPETPLEQLVHLADMGGSASNSTASLLHPTDELLTAYPDLPSSTDISES